MPVDCQWSSWRSSGTCSRTCGTGIQKYKRNKTVLAEYGGSCDGTDTKVEDCHLKDCPSKRVCMIEISATLIVYKSSSNISVRMSHIKTLSGNCCYQLTISSDGEAGTKWEESMGTYTYLQQDEKGHAIYQHNFNTLFLSVYKGCSDCQENYWGVSTSLYTE